MKNIILTIIVLAAVAVLFYFFVQGFANDQVQTKLDLSDTELTLKDNEQGQANDDNKEMENEIENKDQEGTEVPEEETSDSQTQGLGIEILTSGDGQIAQNGNEVEVHYVGTLEDGTKFDSSVDRGETFSFLLGAGQVIKGWDLGVLGMAIGEKRRLTISSELGYGQSGTGPIPPNATLIFEVELIGITN